MHVVIIPLLKCKSKDPADVNNYRRIAIATALSKVHDRAGLAVATRHVPVDCRQPIWFKQTHRTEIAVDFYRNQDTLAYMCFLDAKKAFDRVNHWTLAKKLLDRNAPLSIVKLCFFWYREQEFMVRWGNSLSMTYRCPNGIWQGGQLSPLLYNVYTDDLDHHLQAIGVGC